VLLKSFGNGGGLTTNTRPICNGNEPHPTTM